jgi:hypothetical protein
MTHQELIHRFETDAGPEDSFHHADHVRRAFAYLCHCPPLEALDRFSGALRRYAAARGKPERYNETITHAYFFLIRERMAPTPVVASHALYSHVIAWDEFARRNPDLLEWKNGILTRYYQEATLQSDLARNVFLFPDKCR